MGQKRDRPCGQISVAERYACYLRDNLRDRLRLGLASLGRRKSARVVRFKQGARRYSVKVGGCMSGSSGSGGGASGPEVSCDRLVINTMLASPRPGTVSVLYSGQILEVALLGGSVVVQHNGELVGGLASPLVSATATSAGPPSRAKLIFHSAFWSVGQPMLTSLPVAWGWAAASA